MRAYLDCYLRLVRQATDAVLTPGADKAQQKAIDPIPQNYYVTQRVLGTWRSPVWQDRIAGVLTDEGMRLAYD